VAIGRTADGGQFILTTPFEPAIRGQAGSEFVALYLFDENGRLLKKYSLSGCCAA